MTSHRSRFLTSLGERLQSDLAAHGENREEPTPAPESEQTGLPVGDEPWPEQIAEDRTGGVPPRPAAQVAPEQGRAGEMDARADASPPIGALVRSEGEPAPRPAVPWSETGMPLRLREAIASVRRVSHEMHGAPGDDDARDGWTPFADHPAYLDSPSEDAAAYQEPPPDDPLEDDVVAEDAQIRFGVRPAYREPPDDQLVPFDDDAALQREQMRLARDAADRAAADDELILLDEHVVDDDGQTRYDRDVAYEEPFADDELMPHGEDAPYPHGRMPLADAAMSWERAPGDQAARQQQWLDDEEDREPLPGYRQNPRDRESLWRGATRRYGLPAAALAVAIAFVALAGFGLGILSGARDVAGPLARDALRPLTEPAPPSSAREVPLAELERPAEPAELATVRVAPAPVAAVRGAAPTVPVSNSALPVPPPPKPILRQAAPAEAASSDRQLAAAVDDAAAAVLESEGTGGPFQPLFAKLPASRAPQTQVFVHYSARAVGAPATAMHLVRHLKAAGFAVEVRAIEFPIPTHSIRYFFESDRAQAEALRTSIEGQLPGDAAVTVMDFTSYQPRPRPGLIEVWLRA